MSPHVRTFLAVLAPKRRRGTIRGILLNHKFTNKYKGQTDRHAERDKNESALRTEVKQIQRIILLIRRPRPRIRLRISPPNHKHTTHQRTRMSHTGTRHLARRLQQRRAQIAGTKHIEIVPRRLVHEPSEEEDLAAGGRGRGEGVAVAREGGGRGGRWGDYAGFGEDDGGLEV